jgi:2-polyprenyl-6-methoxyphenol hydroxylase-like FAD-dependent oxidoreductase
MRIAVLGGGTAGFIAAVHLTRCLPRAELLHVFDSRIPTIGVGEGTTPRFPVWFEEITGLGFPHLAERCGATLKRGTRFDGWGSGGSQFLHRFQPARLIGYHFDAAEVVRVLGEHVRAELVDARVAELHTSADGVRLRLDGDTTHLCDYVFDARGFPRPMDGAADEFIQLDWIPTGRAMLRRLRPQRLSGVTRAAARPHGWIFQIPLRDWTSCGYIFNPRISSDAEVEADFTAFLQAEAVSTWEHRGVLNFPNFVRRKMFDGRIFRVGNAACFLEPLEATAIGTAIVQIRTAANWIVEHRRKRCADPDEVEEFNSVMLSYVCSDSLFLAWHYACGSQWDSPFWQYARRGIERARNNAMARAHLADMEEFVDAGRALPGLEISGYEDQERWDREVYPLLRLYRPFGNFSELNFAQIGHGIGYYEANHGKDRARRHHRRARRQTRQHR